MKSLRGEKTHRVILSCDHETFFVIGVPLLGESVYCRQCGDYRVSVSGPNGMVYSDGRSPHPTTAHGRRFKS